MGGGREPALFFVVLKVRFNAKTQGRREDLKNCKVFRFISVSREF